MKQSSLNNFISINGKKTCEKIEEEKAIKSKVVPDPENNNIAPYDEFIEGVGSWKSHLNGFLTGPKMRQIYQYVK